VRVRFKRIGVGLIVVAAVAVSAAAWAGRPRPAVWRKVRTITPSIAVQARSTGPGVVRVGATAMITHPVRDGIVWHKVTVHHAQGGDFERVWEHEFDGVLPDGTHTAKTYTKAPRLKPVRAVLPEFEIPGHLAPGQYLVGVQVLEDAPEAGPEGITSVTHCMVADSAWVFVE
jgi:hypothetical protein